MNEGSKRGTFYYLKKVNSWHLGIFKSLHAFRRGNIF